MRRGRLAALIAMAAVCNPCVANSNLCWEQAGARYGVDPLLLYSIAQKESRFRNDAVNRNRNGTEDVCMMQINSTHFAQLAQWGITRDRLLADPCVCINVGAWVSLRCMLHSLPDDYSGAVNTPQIDAFESRFLGTRRFSVLYAGDLDLVLHFSGAPCAHFLVPA